VFAASSSCSPNRAGQRTWCSSSTAPWCAPMSRLPVPKGAAEPCARPLAWRFLDEDPSQDRP
jgi:hypothetical protein